LLSLNHHGYSRGKHLPPRDQFHDTQTQPPLFRHFSNLSPSDSLQGSSPNEGKDKQVLEPFALVTPNCEPSNSTFKTVPPSLLPPTKAPAAKESDLSVDSIHEDVDFGSLPCFSFDSSSSAPKNDNLEKTLSRSSSFEPLVSFDETTLSSNDIFEPLPHSFEPRDLEGVLAPDVMRMFSAPDERFNPDGGLDELAALHDGTSGVKPDELSISSNATAQSDATKESTKSATKLSPPLPLPYSHHWQMYHNMHRHLRMHPGHAQTHHPHYYHPYHTYHHGSRANVPHYRPSPTPYGQFGKPLYMSSNPHLGPQELITEALDNDVLCGRGGAINNHPGNRRFRDLINQFKYQYMNETKQNKPIVAMKVLDLVKASNPPGRFLVKVPGGYCEAEEERSKEKASQALREGAAKLRKEREGIVSSAKNGLSSKRPKTVLLPNERSASKSSLPSDDPDYADVFEPPRKGEKAK
jgi:hypothetical protein